MKTPLTNNFNSTPKHNTAIIIFFFKYQIGNLHPELEIMTYTLKHEFNYVLILAHF